MTLIVGGSSGFNALLGGWRDSSRGFSDLDNNGYYWSSTNEGEKHAWRYHFNPLFQQGDPGRHPYVEWTFLPLCSRFLTYRCFENPYYSDFCSGGIDTAQNEGMATIATKSAALVKQKIV